MSISTEISLGEFLDKLTVLRIKAERISDSVKLQNITRELELLEDAWSNSDWNRGSIETELEELKKVNGLLWDIEDKLRAKEAKKAFDMEFIELARSVYLNNDRRAQIKNSINLKLGSTLVEEKSYTEYTEENNSQGG